MFEQFVAAGLARERRKRRDPATWISISSPARNFERLRHGGGNADGEAVAPLGDLHGEPLWIYIIAIIYLERKSVNARPPPRSRASRRQVARQLALEFREVARDHADVEAGEDRLLRARDRAGSGTPLRSFARASRRRRAGRNRRRAAYAMARRAAPLGDDDVEDERIGAGYAGDCDCHRFASSRERRRAGDAAARASTLRAVDPWQRLFRLVRPVKDLRPLRGGPEGRP